MGAGNHGASTPLIRSDSQPVARRTASRYVCQDCGAVAPRWAGRCDACGAWNSIVEEPDEAAPPRAIGAGGGGRRLALSGLDEVGPDAPRRATGIAELDRVLGGGLVAGSAVLIGGDPGIGKSTLLLQAVCALGREVACLYISGEEAVEQIRMRAARLGLAGPSVALAAASDVRDILATLDRPEAPGVVVIDSIQTMFVDTLDSAPGTVAQVRASAGELVRLAKRRGLSLLLVGHVTKDGMIAGPRVLEHMVDVVLYFEGERGHQFRILRAVKNRYGATDEIGVFEMTGSGLREVANPSELFLADRSGTEGGRVTGAVVFAGLEGTRPVLVEVQALVAPTALGTPRRAVVGWDANRLAMVLAVLEARGGIAVGANDVYLNVAGGLKIGEPAADLAMAAAIVSSRLDVPLAHDTVVFGEIGLSGEVRPVPQTELRLKEAAKLGFARAIAPRRNRRDAYGLNPAIEMSDIASVDDLLNLFDPPGSPYRAPWRQAAT
ncbi:MAG: DNA repair protein RadA [Rhodospirillaceae bacterium]|nr:DNA repair protein RadA [Rhodospirillaceae bacterium]